MQDFVFNKNDDEAKLTIRQYGKHQWWREFVYWAVDNFCALTGHHLCNSLVTWGFSLAFKNVTAELEIPLPLETWTAWAKLRGLKCDTFLDDEDLAELPDLCDLIAGHEGAHFDPETGRRWE